MALFTTRLTPWVFARDFAALICFYVLGLLFLPRLLFLELLNAMLAAISLTVMVVYVIDIPNRLRENKYGPALIRAGIVLAWSVALMQALGRSYFFAFSPETTGRTFDLLRGFPALVLIVAAVLHIVAIGMIENRYVRRNMCIVIWSLLAGIGLVGVTKATLALL